MKLNIDLDFIGLCILWVALTLILFYLLQYFEVMIYGFHQYSCFDIVGCVVVANKLGGALYSWAFQEKTDESKEEDE